MSAQPASSQTRTSGLYRLRDNPHGFVAFLPLRLHPSGTPIGVFYDAAGKETPGALLRPGHEDEEARVS